jgi:hypothetical protein
VLYENLAWLVQLQQRLLSRERAGSSSSRGQQQHSVRQERVPPWHVLFQAAVGVTAERAASRHFRNVDALRAMITMQLVVLHRLSQVMEEPGLVLGFHAAGSTGGSSSSSSSSGDSESGSSLTSNAEQQQGAAPVTPPHSFEELLPARETLLLLLEVVLLNPGMRTMQYCYPRMQHIWSSMQPTPANAVAAATACVSDAQQAANTMLQPLLHLLGPAVLQQLEAATSSGGGGGGGSCSDSSSDDGMFDDSDLALYFARLLKMLAATGAVFYSGGLQSLLQ